MLWTQFLRPDGRDRKMRVERGQATEAKAAQLAQLGWHFELEELTTREVSLEAYGRGADGRTRRVQRLSPNDQRVLTAVDQVVDDAYRAAGLADPAPVLQGPWAKQRR